MSMKLEVEGTNIEAWQKIYDHWDLERLGYSETCRSDPCVCQDVGCTDNKVTSLQLIGKELTNIPKEIGELKTLVYLSLFDNQLTVIPKDLWELTALTELMEKHLEIQNRH